MAIVWIAIITIIFQLQPNELVLGTMLAVAAVLTGYWVLAARRSFADQRQLAAPQDTAASSRRNVPAPASSVAATPIGSVSFCSM